MKNDKIRILAVDDRQDNLLVIKELVAAYCNDCEVITAGNAENGLTIVKDETIDVAIIDVQMPGMDGIEMCRLLKSDPETAIIPVILLTAHRANADMKVKGFGAGAEEFLTKPIDGIELAARIKVMLRIKKAEDQLRLDKKTLENQLLHRTQKEMEELKNIFNMLPAHIFLKDLNKCYTYINESMQRTFTKKEVYWFGKTAFEVYPKKAQEFDQEDETVLKTGEPIKNIIHQYKVDNQTLWYLSQKIPYHNRDGELQGILGFSVDITERKKLESQLRQSQKMEALGTLAGGIAHDFNNILFPIIGNAEYMMKTFEKDSDEYETLNDILQSAHRAKDLVEQILMFSRKSGQKKHQLLLQPLIKESLKLMRSSIPSSIQIKSYIRNKCAATWANPTQMHQIIMNLCTNAYQAMQPDGGELNVGLDQITIHADKVNVNDHVPGDYLKLTVSDTGQGMSTELLSRIFEPYFTTKKEGQGTGLGLAVVHGIVKSHNGFINVRSKLGQGTTFNVFLPVIETMNEEELSQDEKIMTGKGTIMLVDDEVSILKMLKRLIERMGYKGIIVNDPMEALDIFKTEKNQTKENQIDLVITDMNMPGMNGIQLADKLLRIQKGIPIILCTGNHHMIDPNTVSTMGIKAIMKKPVTKAKLSKTIHDVMDKSVTNNQS